MKGRQGQMGLHRRRGRISHESSPCTKAPRYLLRAPSPRLRAAVLPRKCASGGRAVRLTAVLVESPCSLRCCDIRKRAPAFPELSPYPIALSPWSNLVRASCTRRETEQIALSEQASAFHTGTQRFDHLGLSCGFHSFGDDRDSGSRREVTHGLH